VDGVSAVQLLAKIENRNQDKRIIHVIWDNASYHKGPDVRAFLSRKNCRIHLIQLPPYCPHLNPIERLWAVMHKHVTHNRAYPTQKLFTEAILKFFRKIIPEQWHNFRNQVTDNFRIISEQKIFGFWSERSIYKYNYFSIMEKKPNEKCFHGHRGNNSGVFSRKRC
jgi:transposase